MDNSYSKEDLDTMIRFLDQNIENNIPFCLFMLPEREDLTNRFIVVWSDSVEDFQYRLQAKAKPWLSSQWFDFSTTANHTVDTMPVCPESTPEDWYIGAITELVEILKKRGGKTVICRNICGRFKNFNLGSILKKYLNCMPNRDSVFFLMWHPQMNFWMGSTPELILERLNNGTFRTMALAGTRHHTIEGEWDMKNIEEHNLVANDIESRLKLSGIEFFRMPIHELDYGPVHHLCTEFKSKFVENGHDRKFFDNVVDEIQPTPALAGYPRTIAISEIERFESWPRYMYAGCLTLSEIRLNMTYGIIRCVHFDQEKWSIYTGSGVTADSLPYIEWEETRVKAQPLIECLTDL